MCPKNYHFHSKFIITIHIVTVWFNQTDNQHTNVALVADSRIHQPSLTGRTATKKAMLQHNANLQHLRRWQQTAESKTIQIVIIVLMKTWQISFDTNFLNSVLPTSWQLQSLADSASTHSSKQWQQTAGFMKQVGQEAHSRSTSNY